MNTQTLLLTPWYRPHKVVSWQKAITMLFTGDVEVVDEYLETIRSPSISMRVPAVVRLTRAMRSAKRCVKFSRVNVLARDGHRCQYCGEKKPTGELNYDHVVPRSQGGRTDWDNIVTSCYACNLRKRNRTPEQAGMRLLSLPVRPKTLPLGEAVLDSRSVHPTWQPYVRAA